MDRKKFKAVKIPNTQQTPLKKEIIEHISIEDIIIKKGYPLEIHNLYTEDGYLLRLYRIPAKKNEENYKQVLKPPIFFQHGLFDSSDCWVCNKEKNCYAFILANKGFDIWLGNSRGNKHSKHHLTLSPTSKEFWSFSFDEMARYDLPACLNYISKINKSKEKIIYIGHSQGTTILFSALANNLEYIKSKVKLFIAIAPVVNLANLDANIIHLLDNLEVDKFFRTVGVNELFADNYKNIKKNLALHQNLPFAFFNFLDLLGRNTRENNDSESLNRYFAHYPSGSSLKCFNHFLQILRKKRFCLYDYGLYANMELYKLPYPPDYDLSDIQDFKIVLIVGNDDKLSTLKDVQWLKEKLNKNVIYHQEVPNTGHLGFICGNEIKWFNDVLSIIVQNSEKYFRVDNNDILVGYAWTLFHVPSAP